MFFKSLPAAKKIALLFLAFFFAEFFCPQGAGAQELSGTALSDATFSFLKKAGFEPKKEPLSAAFFADFPYNITVDFAGSGESGWTFYLLCPQEDAISRERFFIDLLNYAKAARFPYAIQAAFTAGDRQNISGNESMAGAEVFCKALEGKQEAAALLLSFDATKANSIAPGSAKKISPLYLTRLLAESMDRNSCPCVILGGIFLSLYRAGILREEKALASFLGRDIPALSLKLLSQGESLSEPLNALKDFLAALDFSDGLSWSQHYIPAKIFSRRFWIEESAVIYSVMIFMALAMFILSDFAFIFRRRTRRLVVIKRRALLSNYLIVLTALAVALSLWAGQEAARLLRSAGFRNIMVLFVIKLAPAFFVVSIFYPIELKRRERLSTYHYEYVLSISAVLNIFIFSFIDICLFYLFAIEYVILALSRVFKGRAALFVFIALFITPFLPLLYSVLIYSDGQKAASLVFCGFGENLLLAFALVPFNLLWLRILAHLKINAKSDWHRVFSYVATGAACFAALALFSAGVIFFLNRIFFDKVEPMRPSARIVASESGTNARVRVYDSEYYGGKIRRIEINSSAKAERYSIEVDGKGFNPVYFSVYDTDSDGRTARFLLPDNPPQKLDIIYTPSSDSDQDIIVGAYYLDGEGGGRTCFLESFVFEARGGEINERKAGDGL